MRDENAKRYDLFAPSCEPMSSGSLVAQSKINFRDVNGSDERKNPVNIFRYRNYSI